MGKEWCLICQNPVPSLGLQRGMDKDDGGRVGEASPQGLATQMGCRVPKISMRQTTPGNRRDQSGLVPPRLLAPFWPGTPSPSHCGHLWGRPGHLGAQCPGYSGGDAGNRGCNRRLSWCTWSGRAPGPGHPYMETSWQLSREQKQRHSSALDCSLRSFFLKQNHRWINYLQID